MTANAQGADEDEWASRSHPVREDMVFQRREWVAKRIGWGVLAILAVLALGGLFSVGSLSNTTASDPSGRLRVEYERFGRFGAFETMTLRIDVHSASDVGVRFNRAFMQSVTLEAVQPEPSEVSSGPGGTEFTFRAAEPGEMFVDLSLRPEASGLVEGEVALRGEEPVSLTRFVYP